MGQRYSKSEGHNRAGRLDHPRRDNPLDQIGAAVHIYGGDFFDQPRSEWNPRTFEEHPYDVANTMRAFEEANERLWGAARLK